MSNVMDTAEITFFSRLSTLSHDEIHSTKKKKQGVRAFAAVDVSYSQDNRAFAVAVVLDWLGAVKEMGCYDCFCTFPYTRGLFYLREGPPAVAALASLEGRPDIVCLDAHGYAHPTHRGLATIFGEIVGLPSVGIAKNLLVGKVSPTTNRLHTIRLRGETAGFMTNSWDGGKRYWSPGYSVSMGELEDLIQEHGSQCLHAISLAHLHSIQFRDNWIEGRRLSRARKNRTSLLE